MKFLYRLERICAFLGRRLLRTASFLYYLRGGIELEYPLCCVIHFAWNTSDPKVREKRFTHGPAVKRGAIFAGLREDGKTKKLYVPCKFHHWLGHPGWEPWVPPNKRQLQLFADQKGK